MKRNKIEYVDTLVSFLCSVDLLVTDASENGGLQFKFISSCLKDLTEIHRRMAKKRDL